MLCETGTAQGQSPQAGWYHEQPKGHLLFYGEIWSCITGGGRAGTKQVGFYQFPFVSELPPRGNPKVATNCSVVWLLPYIHRATWALARMAGLRGANDSPLYIPQRNDSPAPTQDPLRSCGPVAAASFIQVRSPQHFSKAKPQSIEGYGLELLPTVTVQVALESRTSNSELSHTC